MQDFEVMFKFILPEKGKDSYKIKKFGSVNEW